MSVKPISSAASRAPQTEPMPPITTTTKHRISTWLPMPGNTDDTGAASIPPSAASATPKANTKRNSSRMSMPRPSAISRLLVPARMRMPSRVRWITTYISTASTMQTPDMNRR